MNAGLSLLAAAVLASAAASDGGPERSHGPELVEMEVAGVFPLDDAHAGVLVLREKGRETLLPIVVGRSEADQIGKRMRREAPARPRTHDLLEHAIGALGGKVVRVEIRDASDALYRARLFVSQGSQRIELDARPSDSVALAIGAGAPIFAARELVAGSGLTPQDLERMRRSHAASEADPGPAESRM
jgi:uncharacterized protein